MARNQARREPQDDLSDEMLDAYFQALVRRSPEALTLQPARQDLSPEAMATAQMQRQGPQTLTGEVPGARAPPVPLTQQIERAGVGIDYTDMSGPPLPDVEAQREADFPTHRRLMPTDAEREEIRRDTESLGGIAQMVGPFAAGPVVRAAGIGAAYVGNALARTPARLAGTATGVAGATTLAGTAETQTPSASETINSELGRLRLRQTELEGEQTRLRLAGRRFNELQDGDPDAVKAAQRELQIAPDGRLGPQTRQAIEAHRQRIRSELDRVGQDLARVAEQMTTQQGRLSDVERDERTRDADRRMSLADRALRDHPALIGFVGGAALGPALRWGMTRGTRTYNARQVAEADALIPARIRGSVDDRVGRINEFFRRGGQRGNEPFVVAPRSARGFARRDPQPETSTLFRPGSGGLRSGDWATIGVLGTEAGIAEYYSHHAQQELQAARKAAETDRSQAAVDRVRTAEVAAGMWLAASRIGLGAGLSYYGSSFKLRHGSQQPALQHAESEVMRLNRLLGVQRPRAALTGERTGHHDLRDASGRFRARVPGD